MDNTNVISAYYASGNTRFHQIKALAIDPTDGETLQKHSKNCVKFEIKGNPNYFIFGNAFVANKSMLDNFNANDQAIEMASKLKDEMVLNIEILQRFRTELKPELEKLEDNKFLIFSHNGHWDYASAEDKILDNGKVQSLALNGN